MEVLHDLSVPKQSSVYKWCFVPLCVCTTVSTPDKLFVNVPRALTRRKLWLKAARRNVEAKPLSLTSTMWCCEDHFDIEEDMENFLRFKLVGGYLKSKIDAVPHRFDCQPDRNVTSKRIPRRASSKRTAQRLVAEAFANQRVAEETIVRAEDYCGAPRGDGEMEVAGGLAEEVEDHATVDTAVYQEPMPKSQDKCIQTGLETLHTQHPPKRVKFRSKAIMCRPTDLITMVNINTSPVKFPSSPVKVIQPIPIQPFKKKKLHVEEVFTDSSETGLFTSDASEEVQFSEDSEYVADEYLLTDDMKLQSLEVTRHHCRVSSMRYLGVPHVCLFILDLVSSSLLHQGSWLSAPDIVLIVLRKVRMNESFDTLGDMFGISKSHASRVFNLYVNIIAEQLQELIVWPSKESVNRLLPTTFQARYSNVQSIIDCFEIEIEKPTKALNQALTWSDYKKCNTLKYLISCTPDGIVNFVSQGYGGRVSDMVLLEDSGYLDKLSSGMDILADRGFKHVEDLARQRGCKLVRPPSVGTGSKLSAKDVRETKRIASLRIHVERLIRRVREFKLLTPHSCLDIHMLAKVDNCVKIAAGLVNLQGPLIK